MRLQITHETRYAYTPAVKVAQHMCHLRPVSNGRQSLVAHSLQVSPEPVGLTHTPDIFGNTRSFFSMQGAHSQLVVVAQSTVATHATDTPASLLAWEPVRERFRYRAGYSFDSAAEFVFASPYVPRHAEFAAYARPSFAPGQDLLGCACDLMTRIHTEFSYESQSTEVNTPALEALAQRSGVCQDFAHIMIACLRAMGLSARYVSGYLLTEPPPGQARLIGSDASHAWASVYLPDLPEGQRWCDFDPTNNRFGWGAPGEDYVTLAIGRDYGDVSPIRGVIQGGADHSLRVAVTVEPLDGSADQDSPGDVRRDQSPLPSPMPAPTQTQTQTSAQNQSQSQSQSQNP